MLTGKEKPERRGLSTAEPSAWRHAKISIDNFASLAIIGRFQQISVRTLQAGDRELIATPGFWFNVPNRDCPPFMSRSEALLTPLGRISNPRADSASGTLVGWWTLSMPGFVLI